MHPPIYQSNIGKNLFIDVSQPAPLDGFIQNMTMASMDAITKEIKFHGNYHGEGKNIGNHRKVHIL